MASNKGLVLSKLRDLMKNSGKQLNAYILPTDDAHQSEYPALCDRRREYLTGFTGSAGTAVVTETQAALWTDGRYYIQAADQLDKNFWILMKDRLPETPDIETWLCSVLPSDSTVGIDPWLYSADNWKKMDKALSADGINLVATCENLIDKIWTDRPAVPEEKIVVHPLKYTGKTWQQKLTEVREKMTEKKVSCMVLTALDDIAWFFNLRGNDIPHVPVFFAYALICLDSVHLFVDDAKFSPDVFGHLGLNKDGAPLDASASNHVVIHRYADIQKFLTETASKSKGKTWVSDDSSLALHNCIPKGKQHTDFLPISHMKAVKNDVEVEGMKNAHIKDGAALCEYFEWLEREVPKNYLTEISAATKLEKEFRAQHEDFVSISFDTISSVGSNGAIIHYCPTPETDKMINSNEIYLCDSGAQFRDGTTDVTRTMHFGTPTDYEKECFTRVLKGYISLETVVFPPNIKGIMLDTLARKSLWEVGLNYKHGTGHGVGSFLAVHEGPMGISYRSRPGEINLEPNIIMSNEPGYYEDGKFGIRIENLFVIIPKKTKYSEEPFLTFEPITFVPIQTKMINVSLLTESEIAWVNNYHKNCLEKVGPLLEKLKKMEALQWLIKETKPIG